MSNIRKLPPWLKRRIGVHGQFSDTSQKLSELNLNTICVHANCPNQGECWAKGTATVLILGSICTRNCKFCSVETGKPLPPDPTEPDRVAQMVKDMGVKYLVLTSVDRDDLPDGGASHFRDVINRCRELSPETKYEILTPDFKGCQEKAIEILSEALPFVFSHNVETVEALYKTAKPGSEYTRTLAMLRKAKEAWPDMQVKSSFMLGLGEKDEEVLQTLKDLKANGVDRVSIGQYLRPSKESLEVAEYVTPEKFEYWDKTAREIGFNWVMSSPFTRSSYHAEQDCV